MFGWNFLYLLEDPYGTIEFRHGSASTKVIDVFMWVELAMSFIQATIRCGSLDRLSNFPPRVGGLKEFTKQAGLPNQVVGRNDQRYLDFLFGGKDLNASLSPRPLGALSNASHDKMKKKKVEDAKRNVMLSKVLAGTTLS